MSCRPLPLLLLAAALPAAAQQPLTGNYSLASPLWAPAADPQDLLQGLPLARLGMLQLGAVAGSSGTGLSLQAGERWFAQLGVGRTLESGLLSAGGGFRFRGGQALSLLLTHQPGRERLGLALRYDWPQAWYLGLSYDTRLRSPGAAPGVDALRFSAGWRF